MSEWGTGSWGTGSWGGTTDLTVVRAVARSTHEVEVRLSRTPKALTPLALGDALQPASWRVYRADATPLTILAVRPIDDTNYRLILATELGGWLETHTLSAIGLTTPEGLHMVPPETATFRGVTTAGMNRPLGHFDLSNGIGEGSLRVNASGGYERVYGVDLIRKMVLRRLTTMPGSFFHIAPEDFGVGLKVKEPLKASSLLSLKRQIEEEIKREPGVTSAAVALGLSGGVLSIRAKIGTTEGVIETTVQAS